MKSREKMKEQLLYFKGQGLRAFISTERPDLHSESYGLISDGTNIMIINFGTFTSGFYPSFEYKPSREYGSSYVPESFDHMLGQPVLTMDDLRECIASGRGYAVSHKIPLYNGLEDYFKDKWNKENYTEL